MNIALLKRTITGFIWQKDLAAFPAWKVALIKLLRVFYATALDLKDGQITLRATSLVYTTLLSLVPLLAVSFSVLKGFGVHNQLEPALLNLLSPLGDKSLPIVNQIISFVDNMKVGALGTFGLLMLLYTVLSLVKKIENAFNFAWKITSSRNLIQRYSNYLTVILVGPVLIFTAIGIKASVNNLTIVNDILAIEPFGSLILLAGKLVPTLLTLAVFSFIYMLVPNTKVNLRSAVTGAVTATVLWKITSWIFTAFIVDSTKYTAIYSSFAILIIFMLWVYTTWFIVLTGACVAFFHQHPERTSSHQQPLRLSCRLREKLALTVMQLTASRFYHNQAPCSALQLARTLDISEQAILLVIDALEKNGLLAKICIQGKAVNNAYIPAQALENISIYHILNAIRMAEETSSLHPEEINSNSRVEDLTEKIAQSLKATLSEISLQDIVREPLRKAD